MIAYTTLGTSDLARAGKFYDDLFVDLGAKRSIEMERFIAWSGPEGGTMFGVIRPFNGEPPVVGNGVMVALHMKDPAQVDALHAKALALGGKDEGAPGFRFGTFYAAYFRDLDGNKVALVRM